MQAYNGVDQRVHLLSQLIAKANRSFVERKSDDSHTNLGYDPINHRIYGHWIVAEKGNVILALNLLDYQFEWLDDAFVVLSSVKIEGKTFLQLEEAIEQSLPALGLAVDGFRDPLHFEIPEYPFAADPFTAFAADGLLLWERCRTLANEASHAVLVHLQAQGEVRIWPHHFDTGIYAPVNSHIGLGFGLAMEDSVIHAPYFYLSGYALDGQQVDYTAASKLTVGEWVLQEHWKGAALPLAALQEDGSKLLSSFIQEAVQYYLSH